MSDMAEIGRMTLFEFRLRKEAYLLQELSKEKTLYMQAYLNRLAKTVDKSGKKYLFAEFEDFYDEEKRKKEILGKRTSKVNDMRLLQIAKRMQNYEGKGGY